jgi:integrase/recombinase XerC
VLTTPTPQLLKLQQPSPAELTTIDRDNLWAEFGQLKIADSTRKQYVKAIENFCQFAYNGSATPERISEFLDLDRYAAIEMVLRYRRHSIDKNLAPSTINVRLAAIKSLVDMARKLGKTTIDLGDIESIPPSIAILGGFRSNSLNRCWRRLIRVRPLG